MCQADRAGRAWQEGKSRDFHAAHWPRFLYQGLRVQPAHAGFSPSSMARMPSAQRRSTDAFEVPSHPAVSWAASPCAAASRTWAMSAGSPAKMPTSTHRRTRPTTNSRTAAQARASSGPGWKSATGLENMTSASTGLARTNFAEGLNSGDQVRARIAGFPEPFKVGAEKLEAVEEHLTDQPALVPEQLIHRGCRGSRRRGDLPRCEPLHPLGGQQCQRHLKDVVAQRRGSLLRPWHGPSL